MPSLNGQRGICKIRTSPGRVHEVAAGAGVASVVAVMADVEGIGVEGKLYGCRPVCTGQIGRR